MATHSEKSDYYFGGIKEFNLEQIESEVLSESVYLDVFAGSDMRLKKNITPIENALEKISKLEGVTFQWDASKTPAAWGNADSAVRSGLIAQEVASVIPELVRKDSETGFFAMEYSKLTSYLVEAVKDLNRIVIEQEKRIHTLENRQGGSNSTHV